MTRVFYLSMLLAIFSLTAAQKFPVIDHTFAIGVQFTNVVFHPVESLMAAGALDGNVYIWDLTTKELIRTIEIKSASLQKATVIAFSPNGDYLSIVDGFTGYVTLLSFPTGEIVWQKLSHDQRAYGNCFISANEFVTSGIDRTVKLHRLTNDETTVLFNVGAQSFRGLPTLIACNLINHTLLLTGVTDFDDALPEYSLDSRKIVTFYELGDAPLFAVYSPDAHHIAANTRENGVRVWLRGNLSSIITLETQGEPGEGAVAFGPDNLFLFGDSLGHLNITYLTNTTMTKVLTPHSGLVFDIEVDPSGQYMATVGEDKTLILWTFQ